MIKIKQAAEILGIPAHELRRLCNQKKINYKCSASGHRFFDMTDLLNFKNTMGFSSKNINEVDYVGMCKENRLIKENQTQRLRKELEKFKGNASGIDLSIRQKKYIDDENRLRIWFDIIWDETKEEIFSVSHLHGEFFEYKINEPEKPKILPPSLTKLHEVLQISEVYPVRKPGKVGKLEVVLESLVAKIISLDSHKNV